MKTHIQDNGHIVMIQLEGSLDSTCIEALKQSLQDQIRYHRTALILDMKDVNYISSQGLETLLWLRDACRRYHIQFRLAGITNRCRTILELTRLLDVFLTYQNADEAIQSLA